MKTVPVAEIFGPTVQGEGVDQGVPTHFVRFGGCDYSCHWCDTPHAVLAPEVRRLPRMTVDDIVAGILALERGPEWVVLSGGNPALYELGSLVGRLHSLGYRVAVETQGSRWKRWLRSCDRVCLSPKPPSSGMTVDIERLDEIVSQLQPGLVFMKVVVFDDRDLEFARSLHKSYAHIPFIVSAGNDAGRTVGNPARDDSRDVMEVRRDLLAKSLWLTERLMRDPEMAGVRVQSQYHVLLWGNALGV